MGLWYRIKNHIDGFRERCRDRFGSYPCPIFCRWVLFALLWVFAVIFFTLQTFVGYLIAGMFVFVATVVGINSCFTEYKSIEGHMIPRLPLWLGHDRPPTPSPSRSPSPRTSLFVMTIGGDTENSDMDTTTSEEEETQFNSQIGSPSNSIPLVLPKTTGRKS